MDSFISEQAITKRVYWVEKIGKLTNSSNFDDNSDHLVNELQTEINQQGVIALIDHLRLCGDIPEHYAHDSSEEKLYSKYTDTILAEVFKLVGFRTNILKERADVADVEVFGKSFSFVADAKAFRLSRTAKNQKDFKIQAMDNWKHGKPYAMVVCPIYQLPIRSSQIYQQATTRNVCIFTYSHLAVLVSFFQLVGKIKVEQLLHEIFNVVPVQNPSKDAINYWLAINRTMLAFSREIKSLWNDEKRATVESIMIAKTVALKYLATQREKIMQMSHKDALIELIKIYKFDSRIKTIQSVADNGIMGMD